MKHPKLTAQQIRDFLPSVPFAMLLGIKLTSVHRDGVTIECALRPELTNSAAVAHGGVAATLADAAVGVALNRHFGGKAPDHHGRDEDQLLSCRHRWPHVRPRSPSSYRINSLRRKR